MGKTKTAFVSDAKTEEKATQPTDTLLPGEAKPARRRGPRERGKTYKENRTKIDRSKLYPTIEAVKLVQSTFYGKFKGSVELHMVVKKEGLSVQVTLPFSTGKTKKVEIADENTVKKLETGKVDFDVLLATPDMMPKLVPFARILGPKGLMPNPKNGTLIKDKKAADKFSASAITVKTERKAPIIHTLVGKVEMKEKELEENIEAVMKAVNKRQIVKAYLCSTMGPSVKLLVN